MPCNCDGQEWDRFYEIVGTWMTSSKSLRDLGKLCEALQIIEQLELLDRMPDEIREWYLEHRRRELSVKIIKE